MVPFFSSLASISVSEESLESFAALRVDLHVVVLSDVFPAVGAVEDLGLEGPDEAALADVVAAGERHRVVEQRLADDALEDFLNFSVPFLK